MEPRALLGTNPPAQFPHSAMIRPYLLRRGLYGYSNTPPSGAAFPPLRSTLPGEGYSPAGVRSGWRLLQERSFSRPLRTFSSSPLRRFIHRQRSPDQSREPLNPTPTAAAPAPEPLLPAPLVEPLRPGDYGAVGRGEPVPTTAEPFRDLGGIFAALGHREKPLLLGLALLLLAAALLLAELPELPPQELEELSLQELEELRQLLPQHSILFREDPYRWAGELLRQLGCADFRGLVEGETLLEAQQRHRNYLSFLDRFLRPWAQSTAPSDAALLAEQSYLRTLSGTCAREKAALLEQLPAGALRDARLKLVDEWYRELEARHTRVSSRVGREAENPTPWDILVRHFDYQRY